MSGQSNKTAIQLTAGDTQATRAMKQQLETMNGTIGGRLDTLPANATLSQVISTLNALIARINA